MRWALAAVAAAVSAAAVMQPVAAAQEGRPETFAAPGQDKSSVIISNPGDWTPGDAPTTRRLRRGGSRQPLPEHVIRQARLRNGGTPESCLDTTTTRRDTPMNGGEVMEYT
nr:hypothetical protein [Actinomycetota bacterium]